MKLNLKRVKSLKFKWFISSFVVLLFVITMIVGVFFAVMESTYYSNIRTELTSKTNTMVSFFNKYINTSYDDYYAAAIQYTENFSDHEIMEMQFIDVNGKVTISSAGLTAGYTIISSDIGETLKTGEPAQFIGKDSITGERVMAVSCVMQSGAGDTIGILRFVTSLSIVDKQLSLIGLMSLLVGFIIILVLSVINLYFIDSFVKRFSKIKDTTAIIAQGSYGTHIEQTRDDEIGELADMINNMSDEIAVAEKMKMDFISSVSHELRTPLTAINGWAETVLSSSETDKEEIDRGMNVIIKETGRLSGMVESLLEFSRMSGGRLKLNIETMDIAPELEEVMFMYMETIKSEGIKLDYKCEDNLPPIRGDSERLKQVFINVIDNAVKHGGGGKQITVRIKCEFGWIKITIEDKGEGIPEDELPFVKKKFYRGSTKARGSGIGLAMADEIIRLHNGKLDISSKLSEGTTVEISIPAVSEEQI